VAMALGYFDEQQYFRDYISGGYTCTCAGTSPWYDLDETLFDCDGNQYCVEDGLIHKVS